MVIFNNDDTILAVSSPTLVSIASYGVATMFTFTFSPAFTIEKNTTYKIGLIGSGATMLLMVNGSGTEPKFNDYNDYTTPVDFDAPENGAYAAATMYLEADTAGGGSAANPGVGSLTATGTAPILNLGIIPGAGAVTAAGAAPTKIQRGLRYSYPTADTTAGPWAASSGSDLYAMIDEETPSDLDYIAASGTGTGKFKILPVTDPGASTGHVVNYRIWSPVAGNAKVRLVQGSTTVAEWTHTSLPATATLYSQSLTGEQADAITDYDDLYLEFEAT
jgi:hypothetical protein